MNGQTLEQMEKQKQEYANFNNIGGGDDPWWEPGSGGGNTNGGGPPRTAMPIAADMVPGYYQVKLGGTTRPTRKPTRRPTKRPVISAEQAMHRYSYCGAFWTDVSVFI
jgi:hypothetical protein